MQDLVSVYVRQLNFIPSVFLFVACKYLIYNLLVIFKNLMSALYNHKS